MTSSDRSAFERLKDHFDQTELECPDCGYFDEEGEWETETDGSTITYRHECPDCGSVQTKTLDLESS